VNILFKAILDDEGMLRLCIPTHGTEIVVRLRKHFQGPRIRIGELA
jgi:hypothetical protein